jgi:heme/copper-type cytochrome/quinol oxidase subunit 4
MLPFTDEQFLGVFEQYNQAIWPMHVVAYILGIAALVLVVKKAPYSNRAISVILAFFWAWMGIVYHLVYFSAINGAALGFGVLFIVQAALWLIFGVVRPKL